MEYLGTSEAHFLCLERVTFEQLKRRVKTLPNRCYLCKGGEELRDLLLLHCSIAKMVLFLVYSLFGVVWVMYSMRENLLSWHIRKKCGGPLLCASC